MLRRACLLGLLLLSAGATALGACRGTPASGVGLVMAAPQGVLDDATSLSLFVFAAEGRACQADGSPSELPEDATTFELSRGDCDPGATWCGEITLDQGDEAQMFVVRASAGAGTLLAQGCTTAVIDKDPASVSIEVVRFVEESCCGDGVIQADEQCDNGGSDSCGGTTEDAACASDCSTRLLWIDDKGGSPAATGQAALTMAFTAGDGQLDGGLRSAWQWADNIRDIGIRMLQSDLSPISEPAGLEAAHRVYFRCSLMDVVPIREQKSPSITPLGSGAVLAYLTEEFQALRLDAVVYTLNNKGCSDQLTAIPISDQSSSVDAIDVAAGPSSTALVVWEQDGRIFGRTFDGQDPGTDTITISDNGAGPRVAGSSKGWVVTYQGAGGGDDDAVLMRRVSAALDVGDSLRVNEATAGAQDQSDVATTSDGSVAVVYRSGGDVYLQRFSPTDAALGEDAATPVHASDGGEQAAPAIQAGSSGDFFVLAWQSDSSIRARFAGRSSGFLFNNVTGQNEDFEASVGAASPRAPAVAAGDFIAIGWEDQGGPVPGMVARRFPLPKP